ncbi:MAG: TerB family tellurite resistance protein [Candidatus Sumerlaeota bacterium]
MTEKAFIMDLAKLMIAAAWADGELAREERDALKDLLFRLDKVSGDDWRTLEMYLESPASEAETETLIQNVLDAMQTKGQKEMALNVLEELFKCDGEVTGDEREFLHAFEAAAADVGTGVFSRLSGALKTTVMRRRETVEERSALRERGKEDYLNNVIFYDLKRRDPKAATTLKPSEAEVRKLCLATGLLTVVANLDEEVAAGEREAITEVLRKDWDLSKPQAELLVDIACERSSKGLDSFRLSQRFYACTDEAERHAFLKTLFKVANATDKTDFEEIETIRMISQQLKMSHKHYIDAKLTISREDRAV